MGLSRRGGFLLVGRRIKILADKIGPMSGIKLRHGPASQGTAKAQRR